MQNKIDWVEGAKFYAGGLQRKHEVDCSPYAFYEVEWLESSYTQHICSMYSDYQERPVEDKSEPKHDQGKAKSSVDYLKESISVQSERGDEYDSDGGERSFSAAADAFNALTGNNLKGSDVCLILTCVKIVRQNSNPSRVHDDSLLDGVSYLSLWADEINCEIVGNK